MPYSTGDCGDICARITRRIVTSVGESPSRRDQAWTSTDQCTLPFLIKACDYCQLKAGQTWVETLGVAHEAARFPQFNEDQLERLRP